MIKAIAIDLGGVLFAEGKSVAIEALYKKYGYDKSVVMNLLTSAESVKLRKGLMTDDEFWCWAQASLPQAYNAQRIRAAWYDGYVIDEAIFALVKKLNQRFTVIAFSGNIKSRIEYLDNKYKFRKYLDKEVYSYDYHLDKPQREFVEAMIKTADCRPDEILYIDDEKTATVPAQELGIHSILYRGEGVKELQTKLFELKVTI